MPIANIDDMRCNMGPNNAHISSTKPFPRMKVCGITSSYVTNGSPHPKGIKDIKFKSFDVSGSSLGQPNTPIYTPI